MRPIELYRFTQGDDVWTFTSSSVQVVYNSETYEPIPLGRSNNESKNELSKANLEIKFPLNNSVARAWMSQVSEAPVTLTLFQMNEAIAGTAWKGRMAAIRPDSNMITFVFESIFTSMRRPGLRARFQLSCRHTLYRRGCKVDKDTKAIEAVVTARSGLTLTVPVADTYDDGHFFMGMIKGPDDQYRFITSHTGSQIVITRSIIPLEQALLIGDVGVTLYPGCNRTRTRCKDEFDNLNNYGGFPFIPIRNPFDGSII